MTQSLDPELQEQPKLEAVEQPERETRQRPPPTGSNNQARDHTYFPRTAD